MAPGSKSAHRALSNILDLRRNGRLVQGFCLLDFLANSQTRNASKGPDVRLSRMAGAGRNSDDMVAQRVDQEGA